MSSWFADRSGSGLRVAGCSVVQAAWSEVERPLRRFTGLSLVVDRSYRPVPVGQVDVGNKRMALLHRVGRRLSAGDRDVQDRKDATAMLEPQLVARDILAVIRPPTA